MTRECRRCGVMFTPAKSHVRHCSRTCSHSNMPGDLWSHVDVRGPDECWPWTRWIDRNGYGKFTVDGRAYKAHRLAFQLATGQDPGDLKVCHSCDNPPCCNPAHLFLGTQADNIADMHAKGRAARSQARVTEADVVAIRSRRESGEPGHRLAAEFGLSQASVSDIYHRRTWRHVA